MDTIVLRFIIIFFLSWPPPFSFSCTANRRWPTTTPLSPFFTNNKSINTQTKTNIKRPETQNIKRTIYSDLELQITNPGSRRIREFRSVAFQHKNLKKQKLLYVATMAFCKSSHQSSTAVGVINPNSITFLANLRSMKKKLALELRKHQQTQNPTKAPGPKATCYSSTPMMPSTSRSRLQIGLVLHKNRESERVQKSMCGGTSPSPSCALMKPCR